MHARTTIEFAFRKAVLTRCMIFHAYFLAFESMHRSFLYMLLLEQLSDLYSKHFRSLLFDNHSHLTYASDHSKHKMQLFILLPVNHVTISNVFIDVRKPRDMKYTHQDYPTQKAWYHMSKLGISCSMQESMPSMHQSSMRAYHASCEDGLTRVYASETREETAFRSPVTYGIYFWIPLEGPGVILAI